jgi:hypothetical protein
MSQESNTANKLNDTQIQLLNLLKEELSERPHLSFNDKLDLIKRLIIKVPSSTDLILAYIDMLKEHKNRPVVLRMMNYSPEREGGK